MLPDADHLLAGRGVREWCESVDMHVVPRSPQLLVAALARTGSPSENGVALFNDSGVVQYIGNDFADKNYTLDNFTFTSDSNYYGYPIGASFFNSASVSGSGIALTLEGDYQPDNGVQYPAVVSYDPSTFKLAGAIYFSLPTSPMSLPKNGMSCS